MIRNAARRLVPVALAAAFASPPTVWGHPAAQPKHDRVTIARGRIAVAVDVALTAVEAERLRSVYDRDRDGRLSADERRVAAAYLRELATHFLAVSVDGAVVPLAEDEASRAVEGFDRGDLHATFVVTGPYRLVGGSGSPSAAPRRLVLRDRHKDEEVAVPVELVAGPGIALGTGRTAAALSGDSPSVEIEFRVP